MKIFKPVYDIYSIEKEVREQICDKVADRLAQIAIVELEREKKAACERR